MTRAKGLFSLLQHRFFDKVFARKTNLPVQSCFGGLAVYSPVLFFESNCNYLIQDIEPGIRRDLEPLLEQYTDPQGDVCEHAILHLCLNVVKVQAEKNEGSPLNLQISTEGSRAPLDISIQPDLLIDRDPNIFGGLNNPTLVYIIAFLLVPILGFIFKSQLPVRATWRITMVWLRFKQLVGLGNGKSLM
jgi:hypothetical protein